MHSCTEYNKLADELATLGKNLGRNDSIIDIHWDRVGENMPYLRGSWDGGYQPESTWVGVGFVLEGHHCLPTVSGSNWKIIATGYGRCNGGSAANAEILAFQCLVEMIGRVLSPRTTFWKPLSPWNE